MIIYQPIVQATSEQLAICKPWRDSVQRYAKSEGCSVEYAVENRLGFTVAQAEKDYAIIALMAVRPHVLCGDWDIELLPGFKVGGDEIWVGDDHCALVYNGCDTFTFAKILNMWDEYRAAVPTWAHERNRGWKVVNAYLREHPDVKFNRIPKSTYIHHTGEVRNVVKRD